MTTILVKDTTRDKLVAIGQKGDTYDDIIQELLNVYEGKKKK